MSLVELAKLIGQLAEFIRKEEVQFLGHVINKNEIVFDQPKTNAVLHWENPHNVGKVHSFL